MRAHSPGQVQWAIVVHLYDVHSSTVTLLSLSPLGEGEGARGLILKNPHPSPLPMAALSEKLAIEMS